jgi:hypothetical protein
MGSPSELIFSWLSTSKWPQQLRYRLRACIPKIKQIAVEAISPPGAEGQEKAVMEAFLQVDEACAALLGDGVVINGDSLVQVVFPTETDKKLTDGLPSYMVPEMYFAVERLTMATSSNTDRKRLREMGVSFTAQQLVGLRTSSQRPKRQPKTELKCTLQQLWAQVLNIDADSIGPDDSFFRLDGDSTATMKVVGEARKEEVRIIVADIFRNPKLSPLARQILHPVFSSLHD